MRHYVSKPYKHSIGNIKVELDLSNYATKADFKGETSVDQIYLQNQF